MVAAASLGRNGLVDTVRPVASVIVLGYNGTAFLGACLDSVLDQSFPAEDYEVILADNASADGSADFVAQRFPAVRVLRLDRNYGFAEGNNRAARMARGHNLVFLNQDTVAHRDWLAEMVKAMQSRPLVRAGHAAGCPLYPGHIERERRIERGFISEISRFGTVDPVEIELSSDPIPTLHLGGGSMIMQAEVVDELGYIFDPTFMAYGEDLDLGLRLNGLGYRVVFVPTAVCYHDREGRAHLSRRTIRRTGLATRNRFLAYFKNMYADEFLLALPALFWGSVAKMGKMVTAPWKRTIFALGLLPFTAYHLLAAVLRLPRYTAERRRILNSRAAWRSRRWLLEELKAKGRTSNADLPS
jgi:GT2 family glycosyltransferase